MFDFEWTIKGGYPMSHGNTVFSTFACGGGSTMGYKLAGFNVIGANDIDPEMARVYQKNHHPKHYFLCPIGDLLKKEDLPEELFNLDILDGSPPCSTFSMAGDRDKSWKTSRKFREGQADQVLSDLFFDFIALARKLKPKVVVAENVKGMLLGNAKAYTKAVMKGFDEAGYDCQLFLLNSATMGVPQARERVFFIARRRDLNFPPIKLSFTQKAIPFSRIMQRVETVGKPLSEAFAKWWRVAPRGKSLSFSHPKGSFFNSVRLSQNSPLPTITATSGAKLCHPDQPNEISDTALILGGSFPIDYDFDGVEPKYLIGMSVPPVMIAGVASQIYEQWLKKV